MKKEQEREPEMTSFEIYLDNGDKIVVEFDLDEIDRVRGELEHAMQSGSAWFVGDFVATLNDHKIENISGRRIIAYT